MDAFLRRHEEVYRGIDSFYAAAQRHYHFSCAGCTDSCCITKFFHHTLVEEQYLAEGFASLSDDRKRNVCSRAVQVVKVYASSPEDVRIMCPLNEGGMCVLYEHRPMICRMHGVPYEMVGDDGSVEFGSGCHRFMKERVWETTQYFMFNRTMFYREMAKISGRVTREMAKRRWFPVVGAATLRFRRGLGPFQRYTLRTRLVAWDEKWCWFEQRFCVGDSVYALGRVKVLFRGPAGNVPTRELIAACGATEAPASQVPEAIRLWQQAEDAERVPR